MSIRSVLRALGIAALAALTAPQAAIAVPVTLDLVGYVNGSFKSVAVDSVTGKVYYRSNYTPQTITVYDSQADFEAGTSSGTLNLSGSGYYGTYISVKNGVLTGRPDTSTSALRQWNVSDGSIIQTITPIPGMSGSNFSDTFNWGGYSGVNVMQDVTGTYVAGGKSGNDWQITKVDDDLNVLGNVNFTPNSSDNVGYGFVINGVFFGSDSYSNNQISFAIDTVTGVKSVVDFTWQGISGTPYWTNMSYDYVSDVLYLSTLSGGEGIYKIEDASNVFGVPFSSGVPAPGALALLGLGLIGLGLRHRKA